MQRACGKSIKDIKGNWETWGALGKIPSPVDVLLQHSTCFVLVPVDEVSLKISFKFGYVGLSLSFSLKNRFLFLLVSDGDCRTYFEWVIELRVITLSGGDAGGGKRALYE